MSSSQPTPPESPRPPADLNPRREPALDFRDKELRDMTAADYDAIGFMSGLEVHQQLMTRSKLFCRCPAGRYVEHQDAEVLRHMRPTLSELGEYDGTALMEFKTKKEIVYLLERGTVCTYEMDDTPPFEIDEEAVRIAIELSRLCNLDVVSELHVMRKQYLDGSIPTGFQRTAMIGLTGHVPFRVPELGVDKTLRIRQLSLEEDSCREVSDRGHQIVFRTDRLGMPLSECVTEPDLLTPWELQAGGRLLAQIARATGKVRRGVGAARQDVNVSVAGGRRVEIKGVPHHRGLPILVHNEGFRQLNLLRVKHALEGRGVTKELFELPERGLAWEVSPLVADVRSILKRCDFEPIRTALDNRERVVAVRLRGFGGLLKHRTQPGITFARELHGRVRVIACLTSRPFMIHSDITDYGISNKEWRQIRRSFRAESGDAIVVLWGPEADASTAAREVLARAAEALEGVPSETRQAYADGTTGFERILPGPDRMYPDTDTPPLAIPDGWVPDDAELPERPWQREERYLALGLTLEEAQRLASSDHWSLFDALSPKDAFTARLVARTLEKRLPALGRTSGPQELPDAAPLAALVRALESGAFRAEAFETLFVQLADPGFEGKVDEVLAAYRLEGDEKSAIEDAVSEVVDRRTQLKSGDLGAMVRWGMGLAMPTLLGKVDPKELASRLSEALEPHATGRS